eukprot:3403763-Pyramimonas_sp.AAC.1
MGTSTMADATTKTMEQRLPIGRIYLGSEGLPRAAAFLTRSSNPYGPQWAAYILIATCIPVSS